MSQYNTERRITWYYGVLTLLLTTSVICVAIAFNHWKQTLDACPGGRLENVSCGCIFYGISTYRNFNGGHNSTCYYAVFAPLPLIAYSLIMFLFHMYRVCINSVGKYEAENTKEVENLENETIIMTVRAQVQQRNDSVIYCWIPNAVFASVFALYNLVHASIMTDGYFKTCTQYRGYLVAIMNASGNQATAIHYRLPCQAVYDFMDYLQPDALYSRRSDFINTGLALQIALVTTWFSLFLWIAIAFYTSLQAYKEREVISCCGK